MKKTVEVFLIARSQVGSIVGEKDVGYELGDFSSQYVFPIENGGIPASYVSLLVGGFRHFLFSPRSLWK